MYRLLLSIGVALLAGAARAEPGATFDAPPVIAPGSTAHLTAPGLDAGVAAWEAGNHPLAVALLEDWLDRKSGPWGRDRAAGQFLLGWIHLKDGRYNRASENFTGVRYSAGPLAPYGAYYEALADHRRGRHEVAAGECRAYRKKWDDGPHADDCLLLMGDAYAAAGWNNAAIKAYMDWIEEHPEDNLEEAIRLRMALANAQASPRLGAQQLQHIASAHRYHANGEAAERALARLAAEGLELPERDPLYVERLEANCQRACGFYDDAWESYQRLSDEHGDDPMTASWLTSQEERFKWGTKRYDVLAADMRAQYEESPSADIAWKLFRVYYRDGAWDLAHALSQEAREKWPDNGYWRWNKEQLAQAAQISGDFVGARDLWDELAAAGGGWGAKWFGAFTAYRAGDFDDAMERLTALVEIDRGYRTPALYYRAKTKLAMGDAEAAREDFQAVVEADPYSWYAQLVQSRFRAVPDAPDPDLHRIGKWTGPRPAEAPTPPPPLATAGAAAAALTLKTPDEPAIPEPRSFDWRPLAWSPPLKAPVTETGAPEPPPEADGDARDTLTLLDSFLPPSAPESRFYNPTSARRTFQRFAAVNKTRWPYLEAAVDLSRVKVYELSAPYMGRTYEQWKRNPTSGMNRARWRDIFLYAGDHHHATRFTVGLDASAQTPEEADVAARLAWPTAWRREILHWSRSYDLDPYLVLGLIRNESLYRTWALSHAGAIGLMQIIPITGSKVAAHLEEPEYSPLVLENPLISARYGTWYLSQLMERFDGIWPLAVGAYNTGPTNLSSFYQGWQGEIEVDDFVEQIPYRETRLYVKLVTGSYARYLALYGPEDAYVHVPPAPTGDHREVVDF